MMMSLQMDPYGERRWLAPDADTAYLPDPCAHHTASFQRFVTTDLAAALARVSPIVDPRERLELALDEPLLGAPDRTPDVCRTAGATHDAPVRVRAALRDRRTGEIAETTAILFRLPLMLPDGSFVIDGRDIIVIGQLVRSPGLFLRRQDDAAGGLPSYTVQLTPAHGTSLALSAAAAGGPIIARFQKTAVPLTQLLRALATVLPWADGATTSASGTVDTLEALLDDLDPDGRWLPAMRRDESVDPADAVLRVGQALFRGERVSPERAAATLRRLFADPRHYDLGAAGRFVLDRRLGRPKGEGSGPAGEGPCLLRLDDLIGAVRLLLDACRSVAAPEGAWPADDMDHLANRRLRLAGDYLAAAVQRALHRLAAYVEDRLASYDGAPGALRPATLIGTRHVQGAVSQFFAASPFAQLIDQQNPLAALRHRRRVTLLGPGGLSLEQAGFAVRDLHASHYGRLCPIETPEGQKIGLTLSLATYAVPNALGFLTVPYRRVLQALPACDGRLVGRVLAADVVADGATIAPAGTTVTAALADRLATLGDRPVALVPWISDEVIWLTADDEDRHTIAAGDAARVDGDHLPPDRLVAVRRRGQYATVPSAQVELIDLSPRQLLSVSTALLPFVRHDDAHRATMATNMQSQAVCPVRPTAPLVATGLERYAARGAGHLVLATAPGTVISATAQRVVVRGDDGTDADYPLRRLRRATAGALLSQRPAVRRGERVAPGDLLADCEGSARGELALGQNVLVAYLPFKGGNFEDALIVSQELVRDDRFSSIHVDDYECLVRQTPHGPEELTAMVPGASAKERRHLGPDGLPRIGALVRGHDILVGKVTPRPGLADAAPELTPHQSFVCAIIGQTARPPRDTSLRLPHGAAGRVTAVRVERAGAPGVDLDPSATLCRVTVTVTSLRKLVEGDKMAGRHGNKGVVARILPRESMPFLPDGTPVDVVLNSIGVPKRMNVGQLCEAHLGLAAAALEYRVALPAFAELPEARWRADLRAAGWPESGKSVLYDGESGEPYEQPVTVGVAYLMKLHHLVEEKVQARAVPLESGGYAAITQQPVGGKSRGGGQRVGEMEAWALEAYGAAHLLRELFTLKSDDVGGRVDLLDALMTGKPLPAPGESAAFAVLRHELAALGLVLTRTSDGVTISLAGPDEMLTWSHGEVSTWRTLHYRSLVPEPGGLCCARIFGPPRDYTCLCGRYDRETGRAAAMAGLAACERCQTPLLPRTARRERMGHIALAVPVVHPLYARGGRDRLALLLALTHAQVAAVASYTAPLVLEVDEHVRAQMLDQHGPAPACARIQRVTRRLMPGRVLTHNEARVLEEDAPGLALVGWGADALRQRLARLDLTALRAELAARLDGPALPPRETRALRARLGLVQALQAARVEPTRLILSVLPVLPADLRPVMLLEGNRLTTSDLTELYCLVLQRNERVKRLQDVRAPALLLHEAARGLQHAVDALFANGQQGGAAVCDRKGRPLQGLVARLSGKEGRFRGHLLGKRVDYSGRSVIVVASDLKLHQCGLPKGLALTLFAPLVIERLLARGIAQTPRAARHLVAHRHPAVWDALEQAMHGRAVLLNRAPTLHRLGIQAFEPVLVEGEAIHLHPLACAAFNADFDGDQMAVHLPLSPYAQLEAKTLMLATRNLLSPANGEPTVAPAKDVVAGLYALTRHRSCEDAPAGRTPVFADATTALLAAESGRIGMHGHIYLHVPSCALADTADDVETPAGRIARTELSPLPDGRGWGLLTTPGRLLVGEVLPPGQTAVTEALTREAQRALLMDAFRAGGAARLAHVAQELCRLGFTWATRTGLSLAVGDLPVPEDKPGLLAAAHAEIERIERAYRRLGQGDDPALAGERITVWSRLRQDVARSVAAALDPEGPLHLLDVSGAVKADPVQLAGMRGLFADTGNRTIDFPVLSSLREGHSMLEYFVAARGGRKGLVDTALRTREAGYLTRRLVDLLQGVLVRERDCGTAGGLTMTCVEAQAATATIVAARLLGRLLARDARDLNDTLVASAGQLVDDDLARHLAAGLCAGWQAEVAVRSPLACRVPRGVCQACYGWSMATRRLVPLAEAVGIIAAQSIGEPGTQLVMRTFHRGGVAAADITTGLPRVEQLLENVAPSDRALVAPLDGLAWLECHDDGRAIVVQDARAAGEGRTMRYPLSARMEPLVGETPGPVGAGDQLTAGMIALDDVMALYGAAAVQAALVREVQQIYRDQGVDVHDKHVELVARQLVDQAEVLDPGDTTLCSGSMHDLHAIAAATAAALAQGGRPPRARRLLLGMTRAALASPSFLAAAAFQSTAQVLADAALTARTDPLCGVKENVIVGHLVPAGPAAMAACWDDGRPPRDGEETVSL